MFNTLLHSPLQFVFGLIALTIAVTIHEFAHAITADKLGDPTPRLQGRISLNPLVHLDPLGTLMLLLAGFGWGKPVVFDPYNLRNPRKDAALISIAGPTSNFIVAIICSVILYSFTLLHNSQNFSIGLIYTLQLFLQFVQILLLYNIVLGIFNLIPIHPLDGFKIVEGILPREKAAEWHQLERYGMIFLILLIIPLGNSSMIDLFLNPAIGFVSHILIP